MSAAGAPHGVWTDLTPVFPTGCRSIRFAEGDGVQRARADGSGPGDGEQDGREVEGAAHEHEAVQIAWA